MRKASKSFAVGAAVLFAGAMLSPTAQGAPVTPPASAEAPSTTASASPANAAAATGIRLYDVVMVRNTDTWKCVGVPGSSRLNGKDLRMYSCSSARPQKNMLWQLFPDNIGAGYHFVNLASGKCMEVAGGNTRPGAAVQQWTCSKGMAKNQSISWVAGGLYFAVRFLHSGLALDVAGGSTANGARLIQWTENGRDNQHFIVQKA